MPLPDRADGGSRHLRRTRCRRSNVRIRSPGRIRGIRRRLGGCRTTAWLRGRDGLRDWPSSSLRGDLRGQAGRPVPAASRGIPGRARSERIALLGLSSAVIAQVPPPAPMSYARCRLAGGDLFREGCDTSAVAGLPLPSSSAPSSFSSLRSSYIQSAPMRHKQCPYGS